MKEDIKIVKIFEAVKSVTGIDRQTIISPSRVREHYFARMIVTYHLKECGYSVANICSLVGVTNPTAVIYQIKGYRREKTPYFRNCAEKVEKILSKQ